jgi:cobalt-precorrin 5A hydrolase
MDIEKPGNKMAIFALTSAGALKAGKLAQKTGGRLYLPARLRQKNTAITGLPGNIMYFHAFKETVREAFYRYRAFIFVMATGIVVRTIAPLLESKYRDPAVVVVDETGKFAISLVSGHVGGANELARRVAGILDGTAVITTATDVEGKPAVDILAGQLNCIPFPIDRVKFVNRALAEGEPVFLKSRWPLPREAVKGFVTSTPASEGSWQVIVDSAPQEVANKSLYLMPGNLVIGVGCRRGTSGDLILEALEKVLVDIPGGKWRIKALASIDIKKNEEGIKYAAKHYGVPLKIVSRGEIEELEEVYEESEFVKKTVGVGGVCEPAAIIASNRGRVIVPKRKMNSVTVAVAEEKLWWWDWDPETGNV